MVEMSAFIGQKWDAIIIGTGVGGATLGHALARAGKRVLFCEKGRMHLGNSGALWGGYPEQSFEKLAVPQPVHREPLARAGRSWELIEDLSTRKARKFVPFIGAGSGGSSALYGMAMERFYPEDFNPRQQYPEAKGTSLPDHWPIDYETLAPYYVTAEELYRVRVGEGDPLRGETPAEQLASLPPLTPSGQELYDFLKGKGLHPYRLPMACEYVAGCECCQGYLCPQSCKNDSARICLQPALEHHGASLLDECEVVRLEASRGAVTGVVCSRKGEQFVLRGDVVVLAAGALASPAILLRSRSDLWPDGLANDSGVVGRNLMRHFVDLHAIVPRTGAESHGHKELALNDFYRVGGQRFGTVQSFGLLPPAEVVVASLEDDIRHGGVPWVAPLLRLVRPVVRRALARMIRRSLVLASIMEDLPYADNRVSANANGADPLQIDYRVRREDRDRIEHFRAHVKEALNPYKVRLIKQAENNARLAHACGTCRFGEDPRDSVLRADNRAHTVENLYVVDSSFFPSSGGTNPSLTIAANALRVAELLL